ncbi:MAG: glutamate synthase subunit beta [Lachnospiraceae bacterium]|nr:glutamate synthase subunit beta [Lachnospiraceae bacterium]
MGKTTGFMDYERMDGCVKCPAERLQDFNEFHDVLKLTEQQKQGGRCMACGVPFCQSGEKLAGMISGCPLHNLVPETNELVYRGNFEQAYYRLSTTHGLPEFTSRVCPALCENACTCGLHTEPVSTKENEKAIIEYAFANGLVKEEAPKSRTGKKIAIVGSGPAGLAAAQLLNRRGHLVTVFEKNDRAGGLLRYGIPNMKLDKRIIDRRIALLENAGVTFRYGVNVGKDITGDELLEQFDRVILCGGAGNPRDLKADGRETKGIYFAVDFLSEVSRKLMDLDYDFKELIEKQPFSFGKVAGKKVIVVGGGDTGNDCVGTVLRLKAAHVIQLEMMPKPAEERTANNPWPEWPKVLKTDYGQEEAIALQGEDPRIYQTTIKAFIPNKQGKLKAVQTVSLKSVKDKKTGRIKMEEVAGSEQEIKADLVLIAAGFLGPQAYTLDTFHVEPDGRSNAKTDPDAFETSTKRVFTAGDMHSGQSLVVRAIAEGRAVANAVDESLMGYSNL